jgi:hypothetical protein
MPFTISPGAEARMDLAEVAYNFFATSGFVHEQVAPAYLSPTQYVRLFKVSPSAFTVLPPGVKRAPGAGVARLIVDRKEVLARIDEYAAEMAVAPADGVTFGQSQHAADCIAARFSMLSVERQAEVDFFNAVYNTTNFPVSGNTGVTLGTPWSDITSRPSDDITARMEIINRLTGATSFNLLINIAQWRHLSRNTSVRATLNQSANQPGLVPLDTLAFALGGSMLNKIIVAGGTQGTSAIASNTYAGLFVAPPTDPNDLESPQFMRTMKWGVGLENSPGVDMQRTEVYDGAQVAFEEYNEPREGNKIIRARDFKTFLAIHPECFNLFSNVA